jgi:cyclic pyranopterin phosphate synthase
MSYKIKNGKIQTSLCELNVVHHCNLSCRSCSHLSNRMNKYFVDPDQVLKDFSILSEYCHPQHVRLCGGEPLLHPHLLDLINAVRTSGISECIRIVTNGTLLHQMPERLWQEVDQIHISLYPACRVTSQNIRNFQRLARKHNTELGIRYVNRFRESFSEIGTEKSDLVKRIYSTCQIAHTWRCQAISEGYFYRCSPSIMISRLLQGQTKISAESNGLKLARSSAFADELKKFLVTREPLKACRYCLGTVGKRFAQKQEAYRDPNIPCSTEDLVDWKYLKYYELVGNRQVPYLLQRIGAPVKKALLAVRNLGR